MLEEVSEATPTASPKATPAPGYTMQTAYSTGCLCVYSGYRNHKSQTGFLSSLRFLHTQLSASVLRLNFFFFKPPRKCQCIQSDYKMHTPAHNLAADSEEI